jgi:hypothetical protein
VDFRQPLCICEQDGSDFHDVVLVSGIVTKLGNLGSRSGNGDDDDASPADYGRSHLNPGDPRQINLIGSSRIAQSVDPRASDFVEVTFNDCAGAETPGADD